MNILYLHGWQSVPGGVKPSFLAKLGHHLIEPALPDDDVDQAIAVAQAAYDANSIDAVVGSSRGGAIAMALASGTTHAILLCPAWKRFGTTDTAKPGTVILHAKTDEVVPYEDSIELLRNSGLPESSLLAVGQEHRLADDESLSQLARVLAEIEVR